MWAVGAGCILAGYLIASIPFGLLVGRLKGVDVRRHGSGNIGATNVGRVLGAPYGIGVFVLDLLKGLLPVVVAGSLLHRAAPAGANQAALLGWWLGVAGACIIGHMFPIYLGFKGGKGVATSLGVLLGIYPYFTWPALGVFGLWAVVTLTTRYVSLGSVVAAAAFPVLVGILAGSGAWGSRAGLWPLHLFSIIVAVLVIYRHRSNLRRLMQGVESRIGSGRDRTEPKQDL